MGARDHVLLPFAKNIQQADAQLAPLLTSGIIREVLNLVPDEWLREEPDFNGPAEVRSAYVEYLCSRLEEPRSWVRALKERR